VSALPPDSLLRPRAPDRVGRGAVLALAVHGLLLLGLSISTNWRTRDEPSGADAELWSAVPRVAAPPLPAVETPAPTPAPKPEPPPPPAVKPAPPPPPVDREADIAVEKERKARELKAQQEREDKEKQRKEAEKQRAEDLAKEKAEKAEKERLAKEKAEKQRLAEEKADEAMRKKLRDEQMARAQRQLAGEGSANSTGRDAQSSGPSAGYAGRIKARVKPNITFSDEVDGNPTAEVEVRAAPDGSITGKRLLRSSGLKAWDDAVLRAIDKTEVLPRDTDGSVPSTIVISFRPRDL
jgi:colicin import membrane protein